MNLLKQLYRLPPQIEYKDYVFRLELRKDERGNLYLGYYLFLCVSKQKYKKKAFQLGIWAHNTVVVSSIESNYLFKVLVFDDHKAIDTLISNLKSIGLPLRESEGQTIETEFQEIQFNLLTI